MFNRPHVAVALLAAVALLPTAAARAADVLVTDAKIGGGKLVVTGTTAAPNTWVRLDGQTARDFNVKSGADGAFAFGVVYHPGDCIVDLQRLISPTALGATTAALVADCGPAGVSPRGAWTATTAYVANDLVTYLGSTWRARRGNANRLPVSGVDWEQFAAAGEPAPVGDEAVDGASPAAAPDGPAGGDLAGTYPNPTIAPGAVTTTKLADFAVTLSKVGVNSVNSLRIIDGAIASADLSDFAVTLSKVGINSVNSLRIVDGAVASVDILDGAIASADLAPDSVDSAKVVDGSLTASDLGFNSVASGEIATDAVNGSEVAAGAIDSDEILDNSVTAFDLAANSVGNSELVSESVTNAKIGDNAVTGGKVSNNSLTTADIAGTDINPGIIGLDAGGVANGRCEDFSIGVGGAVAGEAVVVSLKAALPEGILLYGARVPSNGVVTLKICNLSGGAMPAITDFPIRIITFG